MSDPLSIAASVAGLAALTGTISKTVFQFLSSIKDAPEAAQQLARSLATLNIALGQIQQNLLDPDFVSETCDQHVEALQQCLIDCTFVFSQLQRKVEGCGLVLDSRSTLRSTWQSVKWSFTDDALDDLLKRVEAEKTTLQLLSTAFTGKVNAGLLRYAKQTEARTRKTEARTRHMNRQLNHLCITLQCLLPRIPEREHQQLLNSSLKQRVNKSSVSVASSVYETNALVDLFQYSDSSLSLVLDIAEDDTASASWQPEMKRTLEHTNSSLSLVLDISEDDTASASWRPEIEGTLQHRASSSQTLRGPPPQVQYGYVRMGERSMLTTASSASMQYRKTKRSSLLDFVPSLDPLTAMDVACKVSATNPHNPQYDRILRLGTHRYVYARKLFDIPVESMLGTERRMRNISRGPFRPENSQV